MARAAKSFSERNIEVRNRCHSMHHPFFDLWVQGKLDKRAMGVYVIQHYFWTSEYFKQFGSLPHELTMKNMKRFAEHVLPELRKHATATVGGA